MSAEFVSVSASSYDPAALAAKLTEKSAEGWSVVSIVPTGGDITAFLTREGTGEAAPAAEAPAVVEAPAAEPAPAPAAPAEPAGWAVAPEPAAPIAPIADAAPTYQPAPAYNPAPAYQPAPAAAPAAAAPAAAAAAPGVPAGWYDDPAGRFELRYWDGGTWTEHVSRAGQQFTDPPVA